MALLKPYQRIFKESADSWDNLNKRLSKITPNDKKFIGNWFAGKVGPGDKSRDRLFIWYSRKHDAEVLSFQSPSRYIVAAINRRKNALYPNYALSSWAQPWKRFVDAQAEKYYDFSTHRPLNLTNWDL